MVERDDRPTKGKLVILIGKDRKGSKILEGDLEVGDSRESAPEIYRFDTQSRCGWKRRTVHQGQNYHFAPGLLKWTWNDPERCWKVGNTF